MIRISIFSRVIIYTLPLTGISNKSPNVTFPYTDSFRLLTNSVTPHIWLLDSVWRHHILFLLFTSPLYVSIVGLDLLLFFYCKCTFLYILTLRFTIAFIAEMVTPLIVVTLILLVVWLCTSSPFSEVIQLQP